MRAGQDLGSIGVQSTVVDVEAEVDEACEGDVLIAGLDSGVTEEERHGEEGADYHGVLAAEKLGVAHITCQEGTKDAAHVGESVVAPGLEIAAIKLGAAILQVLTINC